MVSNNKNPKVHIKNPTLSLCMILKNEEKLLPRCLESVKNYVDEIIIVDTGSTDRTVEIAQSYNAKIYHHEWENSFSKARNYSLKYATCDWIIWLDADEEVEKEDAHKLREIIRDKNVNVICLPLYGMKLGGEIISVFNSDKIFRNHLGFQFEGTIHNYLKYSGKPKRENIRLYHYGYNLDDGTMKKKFIRTSTLLKEQIKNGPEDPIPHNYLAISYLTEKMYDKCIKEALEAIRLFELKGIKIQAKLLSFYTASIAFSHKDDLENAEKYALRAIDQYPDYLDAYNTLSGIYFQRKEYSKCLGASKKYLKLLKSIESDPSSVLAIPYITLKDAWQSHSRMAIIYFERNDGPEGLKALNEAIDNNGNACEVYLKIGKYFMEQNNHILAKKFLNDGLKICPDNKDILYHLAEIFEDSGEIDKALTSIKNILEYYPDELAAQYQLGLLHSKNNHFEEAIISFNSVLEKDPNHVGAFFSLAIAYERVGNTSQAKQAYHDILRVVPENPEALVKLGSIYLSESNYTEAKGYYLKTLKQGKYMIDTLLALSKINIYLNDLESCVRCCDGLLKILNLPRNISIDSKGDLSQLYIDIRTALMRQQKGPFAEMSIEIANLLNSKLQERT